MTPEELKQRTKQFGLRCIMVYEALPTTRTGEMLARQLVRSGTSVGANYRSACRGRSGKDFASKVDIAIEEADESLYWLELIVDTKLMHQRKLGPLMKEGNEIVAILTASSRTTERNLRLATNNQKSQIKNQK
jgi:four helix bundle protein